MKLKKSGTTIIGHIVTTEEYNPQLLSGKALDAFSQMRKDCDRCYNWNPHNRKRQPVDPSTFCDNCHEEIGL